MLTVGIFICLFICQKPCEYVHWKIRVPSTKRRKQWETFWIQYLDKKQRLAQYYANGSKGPLKLELLNMDLP
jgi:hypothetical protein